MKRGIASSSLFLSEPAVSPEAEVLETGRLGAGARLFGHRRPVTGQARRRERRIACVRPLLLEVLGPEGTDRPVPGELRDVSGRGIGLVLTQPLALGDRFSITLRASFGTCALFYQVAQRVRTPDGWQVGAKALGVLGKDGTDRPEHVVMALLNGTCEPTAT